MKRSPVIVLLTLLAILATAIPSASADDGGNALTLPDLVSFSNGIGSVQLSKRQSGADYETFVYQCETAHVENLAQAYIRELRKAGIYISQSKKIVYEVSTRDMNRGVALRDHDPRRATFAYHDSTHGWSFQDVSVYIWFTTGGRYADQWIGISYAKGSYRIADTGARMRMNRDFSPADYYFYRDQLTTEEQKAAYDYLLSKTEAMETFISLEGLPKRMTYDEFFWVWYTVLADNPQIFTVSDNKIGQFNYYSDGTVRSFHVYYFENKKDLPAMKEAYEQAIAEALTCIDPYMTDYQKELALHNWLCNHIRYDHSMNARSTGSFSALVNGSAICEGYSEAFTELLHRAGIEAATVYGFVRSKEVLDNNNHAWNIVRISGDWYYVDVTWDDTDNDKDPVRYKYLNLTTAQMALDHINGLGSFPLCTSTNASFVH